MASVMLAGPTACLPRSSAALPGSQDLCSLNVTSVRSSRLASTFRGRALRVPARRSLHTSAPARASNGPRAALRAEAASAGERTYEVSDMDQILSERDACGVGLIASLKQQATHEIVEQGLTALGCMEHRGGCSADNDSGDGSGLMTSIPWELLDSWQAESCGEPLDRSTTGVGMLFFTASDDEHVAASKKLIQTVLDHEGVQLIGWRTVPVDDSVVGVYAKRTQPKIEQLVLKVPGLASQEEVERELYIVRKLVEKAAWRAAEGGEPPFYFCSLSSRTIVYKGMLRAAVVGAFFHDLKDPLFKTNFVVYHRRFSTNTTPKWPLAQPMRVLGHNGEINTLQGNLNWMVSREPTMTSPVWRGREADIFPVANFRASDSANLDACAEVMVRSGRGMEETLMMLVPEAYQNHPTLSAKFPEVVHFYEYFKGQMEAWDGPALLVFSNGKTVGACLDRNGLRPARYWRTKDDMLYVASEVGVLGTDEATVSSKGRLGPGMMISVDLETGEVLSNSDIKRMVAGAYPYAEWLAEESRSVLPMAFEGQPVMGSEALLQRQTCFGYSSEDVALIVEAMAAQGKEPTFCMGDDTPLPVLSGRAHLLFNYFKQRFAQVTNPPIDPLREGLVMSLEMSLGKRENILDIVKEHANMVRLSSPVLNEAELQELMDDSQLAAVKVPVFYEVPAGASGEGALSQGLDALCAAAAEAVKGGAQLIVLSDNSDELEATRPAIPILLAVGAVHHHLIASGLRLNASIVVETAQCFSTHHFACLVGYGASAVCAYGALETCRQWRTSSKTEKLMTFGKLPSISIEQCQLNFREAIELGLLKILSKMGISLLSSYCGAQIFEAYGVGKEVVERGFKGTVSRIGGLTLDDLSRETVEHWRKGFGEEQAKKLENAGFIQFMKGGEYHGNNPEMSKLLHKAVRKGEIDAFQTYQAHVANRPTNVLRDLLELRSSSTGPIPLEEVESVTSICERFCTGGMSLGAISRECHEVIAIAMNRIGGKSNSGEGGEDPTRWTELEDVDGGGLSPTYPHLKGLANGDTATSKIKQVASGRFGVTPTFLVNADQVEIKIAQGAKPGEGGQLPGKKVSPYIAQLRNSKPGVPLISPPPHHDIYSIEDLAQLIHDLHQINPQAKVSVKLVAEAGIGTVASGVAKANADVIQVSGHDGGTGASPISSIKHAGGPWELGLAETHKTLLENGLRDRVVVRVDGGFKAGSDVLLAAAMGADEFGFGTVAMIATGCIMARICHTNNCPVGVASQREELRARFPGVPGDLVNFFLFVAEEVRAGLADLGLKSLDELIGRTDLLTPRPNVALHKTSAVDVSYLTEFLGLPEHSSSWRRAQEVHSNGPQLDDRILANPAVSAAITAGKPVNLTSKIVNVDRSACGRISGAIAKLHGNDFPGRVNITFLGSAGQSFGCFLSPGMNIKLIGEGNDYVGKGMAGGEISVMPSEAATFAAESATIIGNTCLYGATGGKLFVRGCAGERFAVRNSAAQTVLEGSGDHCCEYMTGGVVVALGKVGRNVAAGMTGGLGYFLDEDGTFPSKVNMEIVRMQRVPSAAGEHQLKSLIEAHVANTGSEKAARILADWESYLPKFWQLVPPSEAATPEASASANVEEPIPAMAA